ncbi:NADH-quinone oxidoreductase subunit L [Peribacillus asahii]|uniref:NADH-quinone oxidoreductase subunit L n=1 Tax=Peribacillus asahii TaxID=228899 RepID=UPI0038203968
MVDNAWLIPLFPLASFFLLLLFGKRLGSRSAEVGSLLTFVSFICAAVVFTKSLHDSSYKQTFNWLTVGDTQITVGFELNPLNVLMLVLVSLISFLVHMYSKGYMNGEKRLSIFYAYLGLFTFAMLALVMSPNLLQLYVFWELVGLGSFLLIGFYFHKQEAKRAAKKAFIMTRIGDMGLLIGMILLFWQTRSFEYSAIFQAVKAGDISQSLLTFIAIMIFVGAVGKSGQFPLHTWLPDAMEGPTPVSALIHAATMVAAGVYLVAAMYPLFQASEIALLVVAVTGGLTALFAASIAVVQTDVKRILAYSTMSQLGFMFLALGTAGYVAAVFHLVTHAFFKALLFLAAGSVIHAVHTQNIEKMGGLWKKLRWTGPLFLIGTLAISGVPLLSGFFSKEEILLSVWENGNYFLFTLVLLTSLLTAFYMFRLFFSIFGGEERTPLHAVKESPMIMWLPMTILAVFSIGIGYVQTPWFGTFLGDWLTNENSHHESSLWLMFIATIVSGIGIGIAYMLHRRGSLLTGGKSIAYRIVVNKYYIDELYERTIIVSTKVISRSFVYIERYVIDGFLLVVIRVTRIFAKKATKLQSGQVQQYGAIAFLSLAVLVVVYLVAGGYLR